MRAITLTQPWATLVAIGAKRIETRSWSTQYRGPLAIHAAKGFPQWARQFTQEPPVSVLLGMKFDYPKGAVLATARLIDCVPTHKLSKEIPCSACKGTGKLECWQDGQPGLDWCSDCDGNAAVFLAGGNVSATERGFGDYDGGRFGWFFEDVVQLPEPIPAKGALGLWEWMPEVSK